MIGKYQKKTHRVILWGHLPYLLPKSQSVRNNGVFPEITK